MKLYTEEQVRKAIDFFLSDETKKDKIIETLTLIELPSDEEIGKVSNIRLLYPTDKSANFRLGAKWIKEQILGKEDKTFKQKSKWTEVDNMTRQLK